MFDHINEVNDPSAKEGLLNNFSQKLENFKKVNPNMMKKNDNFNSLTLKSEFSVDFSDYLNSVSLAQESSLSQDYSHENTSMIREEVKTKESMSNLKGKSLEFATKIKVETIDNILNNIVLKTDENTLTKKDSKKSNERYSISSPVKKGGLIEMKSAKRIKQNLEENMMDTTKATPKKFLSSNLQPTMIIVDNISNDNNFFYSSKIDKQIQVIDEAFESKCEVPKENEENMFEDVFSKEKDFERINEVQTHLKNTD